MSNNKPLVPPRPGVRRSTSRVKDLQSLFLRGASDSSSSNVIYSRPTISVPIKIEKQPDMSERMEAQQSQHQEQSSQSMRSLVPKSGFIARRRQSRSRERSKQRKEPSSASSSLDRDQSPSVISQKSYKLPALVRDHTVTQKENGDQKKLPLYVNVTAKDNRLSGEYENVVDDVKDLEEEMAPASKAVEEECYFSSSSDEELEVEIPEPELELEAVLTKQKSSQTLDFGQIKQKLRQSTKLKPSDYVGFSKLPYQVYRRAVKNGFQFNLMVLGEAGVGKSSLINSMFWADIMTKEEETLATGQIRSNRVKLEEGDVRLDLNILSMPGYGDNIDNTDCWEPIKTYIEEQFKAYLTHETLINRQGLKMKDSRVHACLYFISPMGHGLKPLDLEVMKTLQNQVNIIPVIAKSDAFTTKELQTFKDHVRKQIEEYQIKIYNFSPSNNEQAQEGLIPFAVVSSNTITVNGDGKEVRGREYPWGTVNIEDKDHCDFTSLQSLLWAYNTQDLIDTTHNVHYENYRYETLLSGYDPANVVSLPEREFEKKEHDKKMDRDEHEMNEVFKRKVEIKSNRLTETEANLNKSLMEEMKSLEKAKQDLKELREMFQKEKKVLKHLGFT